MAKVENKVIDIVDADNTITSINTKRLDSIYIEDKIIRFVFSKRIVNTSAYKTAEQAVEVKRKFMEEWREAE